MLRRIAYVSFPSADLAPAEISRIFQASRANNEANGITGVLVYTGSDFAAVCEGTHDAIEALWRKLAADPRHHGITRFLDESIERPWFGAWRIGFLHDQSLSGQIAEWRALRARLAHIEREAVRMLLSSADAY